MKQKRITLLTSILGLALLASCGGGKTGEDGKQIKAEEANKIIESFSGEPSGKFQLTYTANYDVDVDSNGGSGTLDSFKHKTRDVTKSDVDFTSGDLYLKISKESKDLLLSETASKTEALVYKEGSQYFYVTSTMENPVALASEAAAKTKIGELIQSVSYNLGGYITTDTLKYEGNHMYEWREFGLSSTAITPEFCNDPYYYGKLDDGGLVIKTKPEYVGYKTDSGISDFSNKTDNYAADVTVKTDSKGLVTSYLETFNTASLDFAIMTPAPTVKITGTREFQASYSATFTKLTTIDHKLTLATITWDESNYGDYEVYTCAADSKENKTKITSGTEVKVGDLLAVKVIPAGSNQVKAVTLGTTTAEKDADGFYYFEITEGNKKLSVNFTGSDTKEEGAWATVSIELGEHVTALNIGYINYPDTTILPLDNQNRAPAGPSYYLTFSATFEEGYELDAYTCNGNAATNYGFWCYNIREAGSYLCKATAKKTGGEEEVKSEVNFTIVKDDHVTSAKVFTLDNFDFAGMKDVTEASKADAIENRYFCIKAEVEENYKIDIVRANEKVCGILQGGYYCFKLTAGTYEFNITTRPSTDEINYINFTIEKGEHVSSVRVFTLDNFDFAGMLDFTDAKKCEAKTGRWLCLKVETEEGYVVDSVKTGETNGNLQGGYYCFNLSAAGDYTFNVTAKAAA